jgi:hypothetical protein
MPAALEMPVGRLRLGKGECPIDHGAQAMQRDPGFSGSSIKMKGMGGRRSRAVPNLVGGVEQGLLFEQGAGHRQQAVGDGAQGAAVAVAALA